MSDNHSRFSGTGVFGQPGALTYFPWHRKAKTSMEMSYSWRPINHLYAELDPSLIAIKAVARLFQYHLMEYQFQVKTQSLGRIEQKDKKTDVGFCPVNNKMDVS